MVYLWHGKIFYEEDEYEQKRSQNRLACRAPDHESVTYDTFDEVEGDRTKLTSRTEFASAEALQGAIELGMEKGAIDSMERFAEHLAKN
jgi:hypothetical protein